MLPVISGKTHQLCQLQLSDTIVPTNYQMNPSYIEGISAIQAGDFSLTIITWTPPILQSPWLPWGPTPGESRLWRAFNNCTLTELENIDNTFITEYKQSSPRSSGRYKYNIPYPVSVVDFSVKEELPFQTTCYCRVELRSDIPDSLRAFLKPAKAGVFSKANLPRHLGSWQWGRIGTSKT